MFFSLYSINVSGQLNTSTLNSKYDERNPILSPDKKTLYFIRKFHPENVGGIKDPGDIWKSTLVNGNWSMAVNVGAPANNKYFNGVVGFIEDNKVYLHGHYTSDGSRPRTQGISTSQLEGGTFTFPEAFPVEYFMNRSEEESISLSPDGSIMVFSLESYGTYGEEDLYVSFLQPNGKWSQPRNLGYGLNTELQEMTPYLAPDNKTLYFSSNGYEGVGSKDIFITTRLDDTWQHWSAPKNLGQSVNSVGMELSFLPVSEELAYFISTQNSDGYGDIKMKKLDPETIVGVSEKPVLFESSQPRIDISNLPELKSAAELTVYGNVLNNKNNEPLQTKIEVNGENYSNRFLAETDGNYSIKLPKRQHDVYELVFSASGYLSRSEEIRVNPEEDLLALSVSLYPVELGSVVNLDNVNFYRGTPDLIESSYKQLQIIAQLMIDNPNMEIELSGHTDNQGNSKLNLKLSQDRVDKVKEYLILNGISAVRISGRGYGGTQPIASNASEETRKFNRRVEFIIVRN